MEEESIDDDYDEEEEEKMVEESKAKKAKTRYRSIYKSKRYTSEYYIEISDLGLDLFSSDKFLNMISDQIKKDLKSKILYFIKTKI